MLEFLAILKSQQISDV